MMDGLWLMAVGMSTVFAFLTLLVATMELSARVFRAFPEPERVEPVAVPPEIAVVLAALHVQRVGGRS